MSEKIQELINRKKEIELGGGEEEIEKQKKAGKLTARERIRLLLDEGSFIETDMFVEHRSDYGKEEASNGDGVITGYGTVDGRLVYVYAHDYSVMSGSLGEMHADKIAKLQDMALKMGAPIVALHDSAGARIEEGLGALSGYGKILYNNTRLSGVIPQISAIMGPSAGVAVYSPSISDYVFMVEDTSKMFMTGPQIIKAVSGEDISQEELGGAKTHASITGAADFIDGNEEEAIEKIKELLSFLPSNNLELAPAYECEDSLNRVEDRLNSIVPEDTNTPYDMKEIIELIADDNYFFEVKENFAENIITGYIRLNGKTVGVVANQPKVLAGCLNKDACKKASRFIRTCDAFNIPLLNLVDVPGFVPSLEEEHGGIIEDGAKMIFAYGEASVPKVTLVVRKAHGGAYLAMCSKELGADQVLAWPSAELAVTSPETAANILYKEDIGLAEDPVEMRAYKINQYKNEEASPYAAAKRAYVDDIIIPSISRPRLVSAFDMLETKRDSNPDKKHGNIPL